MKWGRVCGASVIWFDYNVRGKKTEMNSMGGKSWQQVAEKMLHFGTQES